MRQFNYMPLGFVQAVELPLQLLLALWPAKEVLYIIISMALERWAAAVLLFWEIDAPVLWIMFLESKASSLNSALQGKEKVSAQMRTFWLVYFSAHVPSFLESIVNARNT